MSDTPLSLAVCVAERDPKLSAPHLRCVPASQIQVSTSSSTLDVISRADTTHNTAQDRPKDGLFASIAKTAGAQPSLLTMPLFQGSSSSTKGGDR